MSLMCDGNFDSVLWFKGGVTSLVAVEYQDGVVDKVNRSLVITNFHAINHAGYYYCIAILPGFVGGTLVGIHSCRALLSHASELLLSVHVCAYVRTCMCLR